MADTLDVAQPGDHLSGDDIQSSIDTLRRMANDMEALKTASASIDDLQQIGQTQASLLAMAGQLVNMQVDLLAGKVRITGEHIDAAVTFANGVIAKVADVRRRIQQISSVLAFLATVLTGDGEAILGAAFTLKSALAT
jgi:hypothetical protein